VTDSGIEVNVGTILQARRDVVAIRGQWPRVYYNSPDGEHSHVFDAWVRLDCGKRVAIAIKPAKDIYRSGLIDTLNRIAAAGIGGFADDVTFMTELDANPAAEKNAQEIILSRRNRVEAEYEVALADIASIRGAVLFRDLYENAPSPGFRKTALWCLIDEGRLAPIEYQRIGRDTPMIVIR
jgi:hypothetical protein